MGTLQQLADEDYRILVPVYVISFVPCAGFERCRFCGRLNNCKSKVKAQKN